jgi:hypothetical protein
LFRVLIVSVVEGTIALELEDHPHWQSAAGILWPHHTCRVKPTTPKPNAPVTRDKKG